MFDEIEGLGGRRLPGLSWCQEAGSFFAQRWFPDADDDVKASFSETPGREVVLVENLVKLEAVIGRPPPEDGRTMLTAI